MADINLASKAWCDLVFEGKNKEYGAYVIRQGSPRRHRRAMVIVVVFALVAFSLPALIRIVTPKKEKMVMTEVTELSKLPPAEVKNNDEIKSVDAPPPPPLKSSIKFTAPVIKKDEEVAEQDEIKSQEEITNAKVAISIADVKGDDEENGVDIAELKEIAADPGQKETIFQAVEQMPQFPGGTSELMAFISKNLRYPHDAAENGTQGRVIIRFVVSATGEVSGVEILRGLDRSCDQEAMRVVRMMPKWLPGKQNGKAVPVYYSLPVTFKLVI